MQIFIHDGEFPNLIGHCLVSNSLNGSHWFTFLWQHIKSSTLSAASRDPETDFFTRFSKNPSPKTHRIPTRCLRFIPPAVHTWVVPAASGSAASPPLPLIQAGVPLLQLVVLQGVSCQVAELQAAELTQEVTEGHPETPNRTDAPLDQVLVLFFFSDISNIYFSEQKLHNLL